MNEILSRLEGHEKRIEIHDKRIAEQKQRIAEQAETIAAFQEMIDGTGSLMRRRLNGTVHEDEDCLPRYNSTLGYCVFDMPLKFEEDTLFDGEATFEDGTYFFDDVRIGSENSALRLDVGGVAYFENEVFFENGVQFSEEVIFLNDVTVEGPEKDSENPTEVTFKHYVEVALEEDKCSWSIRSLCSRET